MRLFTIYLRDTVSTVMCFLLRQVKLIYNCVSRSVLSSGLCSTRMPFVRVQLGKLIVAISRGRKNITSALKRTRYKEMKRSALEKKNPAKGSGLPFSFHVRDLLGLGVIRELETPSGAFLRLARDA